MRTKTLLIAAAALAATVISSEAQTVFSANVVGYVNVVLTGAPVATNSFTLICNPLDDGNGNILTNLLPNLPAGSSVTTWAGTAFNAPIGKTAAGWPASAGIPLPPGVGFFVKNGKATPASPPFTNTFVGTVVCPNGATVTNALVLGFNLVGNMVPYAGDAVVDTTNINLSQTLPKQSSLTDWNPNTQQYDAPVGKTAAGWPVGGTFPVSVGEGFFVKEGLFNTNWVQTLVSQ